MSATLYTARQALRRLARQRAFTLAGVLTLGIGIGGAAAAVSVLYATLLRPVPFPDADRLVIPWQYSAEVQQRTGFDRLPCSPADFHDFQSRQTTFEHLAAVRAERVTLTGGGEPERVGAVLVSPEFFQVLPVRPVVGRTLTADDAGGRALVIAESLWERRFGADPAILARTISVNGQPARVIGVLPRWFRFPAVGEVPEGFGFSMDPVVWSLDVLTTAQRTNRGGKSRVMLGKLAPGVSIERAEQNLAAIAADIARDFPASNAGWTVRVVPFHADIMSRVRPAVLVLLAAVAGLLLIACVNLTNLLLLRVPARQRETAVRRALGASRARLMGELLAESLLMAVLACLVGVGIGAIALEGLRRLAPPGLPAIDGAVLGWRVVAVTAMLTLLASVVAGLVPAVHTAGTDAVESLRSAGRGSIGSRLSHRIRRALVVAEVAIAALLLVGMGLLAQTLLRLTSVPTGFTADGVLTMEVTLADGAFTEPAMAAFFDRTIDGLSALPGVVAAAATSGLPLAGQEHLVQITVAGAPRPEPGREVVADYRSVTPGYFDALEVPLLAGATLPEHGSARLVVVNETLARTAWPGQDPIGRGIKLAAYDQDAPLYRVAGVVGNTRLTGLDRTVRPQVYVDHRHEPSARMALVLRASVDPLSLAAPARAAVAAVDDRQPVTRIRTMQRVIDDSLVTRRFQMFVAELFAALAAALAVVGLYAVVAYSVANRRNEMGVRAALGARPADLLALVVGEGLRLVAAGVVAGLLAAVVLTRFLEGMLFGVQARDPLTFALVAATLLLAGGLGCLAPAVAATRVAPADALRSE